MSSFYGNVGIFQGISFFFHNHVVVVGLSDKSMLTYLAKKCFPGQSAFLSKVFEVVFDISGPFGMIVIDFNNVNVLNHR